MTSCYLSSGRKLRRAVMLYVKGKGKWNMDETLPPSRRKRRPGFWPFKRDSNYHQLQGSRDGFDLDVLSPPSEVQTHASAKDSRVSSGLISSDTSINKPSPRLIHLINGGRGLKTSHEDAWVKGVLVCACATSVVLFINIILAIVASSIAYSKYKHQDSSALILYQGKCVLTRRWAGGLHFVINVLSTIVLAASNYCMQCLSSPSRQDVDRAHAQRMYLDIGTPSITNFYFVGRRRFLLWVMLLMSSLPIHLIYNSAVFSAVGTSEYGVVAASADFNFDNLSNNASEYIDCFEQSVGMDMRKLYTEISKGEFEKLTKQQCIDRFAADYVSGWGTVVIITNDRSIDNQSLHWVGTGNAVDNSSFSATNTYEWMCSGSVGSPYLCNKDYVQEVSSNWSVWIEDWSYPLLEVTVDSPDGPTKMNSTLPYASLCFSGYNSDYNSDFCRDTKTLSNFMLKYPSEASLKEDLADKSHWINSSWAQEVKVQQNGFVCASATDFDAEFDDITVVLVDHCLGYKTEEDCQLLFSLPICIAVILCNISKIVCMFLTAKDNRKEIFLTVGDAISSFLTKPDPTTEGRCLMSISNIGQGPQPWVAPPFMAATKCFQSSKIPEILPSRKRWIQAVSIWRWLVTISLCIILLSVSGFLLSLGVDGLKNTESSATLPALWKLGFGTATSTTLITLFNYFGRSPFVGWILLANAPQVIVSTAYFLYNGLLTHMLLAAEYDDYAMHRKPLRVSWPKGLQRSTYYLSLPYRYSIPLMVVAAVLHWLISESIFYVEIVPFDMTGQLISDQQLSTCGYSPISIIFAIILGSLMVFMALGLGMRRYKSNMPLVRGCSAAISAACHPLTDDDHALKPIMWGEIPNPKNKTLCEDQRSSMDRAESSGRPSSSLPSIRNKGYESVKTSDQDAVDDDNEVDKEPAHLSGVELDNIQYAHCSFTSGEVITPNPVRLYV